MTLQKYGYYLGFTEVTIQGAKTRLPVFGPIIRRADHKEASGQGTFEAWHIKDELEADALAETAQRGWHKAAETHSLMSLDDIMLVRKARRPIILHQSRVTALLQDRLLDIQNRIHENQFVSYRDRLFFAGYSGMSESAVDEQQGRDTEIHEVRHYHDTAERVLPTESSGYNRPEILNHFSPAFKQYQSIVLEADFLRVAAYDVAEQMPIRPFEAHQLPLLDRGEIARRGIEADAGKQHSQFDVLQIGGMPHHALARQIVAALPQEVNQRLRRVVTVHDQRIAAIGAGKIAVQESAEILEAGIVLPYRIVRVLEVGRRDQPLGVLKSYGLDHAADRGRDVAEKV